MMGIPVGLLHPGTELYVCCIQDSDSCGGTACKSYPLWARSGVETTITFNGLRSQTQAEALHWTAQAQRQEAPQLPPPEVATGRRRTSAAAAAGCDEADTASAACPAGDGAGGGEVPTGAAGGDSRKPYGYTVAAVGRGSTPEEYRYSCARRARNTSASTTGSRFSLALACSSSARHSAGGGPGLAAAAGNISAITCGPRQRRFAAP